MLKETKLAMGITVTKRDPELASLIQAGARDLQLAGIELNGDVDFTESVTEQGDTVITDNSTITDPLVVRAIITYVRFSFGSPPDYDRLVRSYGIQKGQLQTATGYTDWGEGE